MKDWKLHFIFGNFLSIIFLFTLFILGYRLSFLNLILLVLAVQFTSIFPDVDLKKSKVRSFLSLIISFLISFFYMFFFRETWFYGPVYFLIIYFIIKNIPTKHRGITHTFKFSIIFSLFFALVLNNIIIVPDVNFLFWFFIIFLSYSLHLILDKL